MSTLKAALIAASIALVAGSSMAAAQSSAKSRAAEQARAAYAATNWYSGHSGNVAADTTREGLVMTSQ